MKTIFTIILAAFLAMPFATTATAAQMTEATTQTDKKTAKKKAELKEVTFKVDIDCAGCVKKIQENIAFEKGVKDLKVSLQDQTVYIKYDASKTNEATLKTAIQKLGHKVLN